MNNIKHVDLNLLVAFDVLYDLRNVTRAADRLALTQPTVSGMLARLRDVFGDPLFVRTQHGILPTPRAEALAEPVKAVLAEVEVLIAPPAFEPASAEMTIAISANDYMQQALVVPFIARLRRQAPGIRVAVVPPAIADLAERLARGAIDLAVTIPAFADSGLSRSLLYTERYVCVARRGHPLAGRRLSLQQFCGYEHLVVSPTGGSFAGPTDDALAALGASRRVTISLPNFHVLLDTLRADDFLALVPERLLRGRMAGMKWFEPPVLVPDFDVIACWHRRVDADPAHRWIRRQLESVARSISARA